MHIETNVCNNSVGTLLNIKGKTKDTMNAWLETRENISKILKIRKYLHLIEVGNKWVKPYASYTVTNSERVEFCKFLIVVKFSDGFISNISEL